MTEEKTNSIGYKMQLFFFKSRSYTPIPILLVALILANPNWISLIIGLPLIILGEWIRFSGVARAGGATRTREVGAPSLVTSGIFAHTRNPLYLGNFLLSLGICIYAWAWMPWMIIVYVMAYALQYGFIIALEEDTLREKFGEVYEDYFNNVPRFIPNFKSYNKQSDDKFDSKIALRSERSTFRAISAVIIIFSIRWFIRFKWGI